MNLPIPFAYPTTPHIRLHGPLGYKNYISSKPFLRDEFEFRCVYCLERETWYPNRDASFASDHFEPKVINPERELDYENLVYSCTRCNSWKGETIDLLNPSLVAMADHLNVHEDGQIEALTPDGQNLIELLDLEYYPAFDVREEALLVLQAKREHPNDPTIHAVFLKRFGCLKDLPDLSKLKPPGGNSRPDGIADSHHARKIRGQLPKVY